jgi:hypothetical protein
MSVDVSILNGSWHVKKDSRSLNAASPSTGRSPELRFFGRRAARTHYSAALKSMPITPGKGQEVVGVEVVPGASCPAYAKLVPLPSRSRHYDGPSHNFSSPA